MIRAKIILRAGLLLAAISTQAHAAGRWRTSSCQANGTCGVTVQAAPTQWVTLPAASYTTQPPVQYRYDVYPGQQPVLTQPTTPPVKESCCKANCACSKQDAEIVFTFVKK